MRLIRLGRAAVVGLALCGPTAFAGEPDAPPKPSLWQRMFGPKAEVEPRAKMAPPPVALPRSAREEQALYIDRLKAIDKLRIIAAETEDAELEREILLLEQQLNEVTKQRMDLLKSSDAAGALDKELGSGKAADPRTAGKPPIGKDAAAKRGNK